MMNPVAPPKIKCHRAQFKKTCASLCETCWLWCSIPTKDGAEWMCADLAKVKLQHAAVQEMNGTGRAVESFRNEMVSLNQIPVMKKINGAN